MKKISKIWLLLFTLVGILSLFAIQCKDDEEELNPPGGLTTSAVTRITDETASCGGIVTDEGNSAVTARGVCWGTAASPTIMSPKTSDGADTGTFISSITGLTANTTYYVRAYATNSDGTSYGNEVTFDTPPTVTDIEGNVYHTVIIGDQVWMAENLKVTMYRNGNPIPNVIDNTEWASQTSGAYCQYGDGTYGMHYNGYAVLDSRGLAPQGWHIASDAEWKTLEGTVDSQFPVGNAEWDKFGWRGHDAGYNLKETGTNHWNAYAGATDKFGFTALPGGYRNWDSGLCTDQRDMACFFTSSPEGVGTTWGRVWSIGSIQRINGNNRGGGSVRCIKDKD